MFSVAGANCFGQWFCNLAIIEGFHAMDEPTNVNFALNRANLVKANWSYNIFEIDNIYYISGSWMRTNSQLVTVPLPRDFPKDCISLIVAGNDNYIVLVDVEKQMIFIMDLKFRRPCKRINLIPEKDANLEHVSKKKKSNSRVAKVVITNNACIYWTIHNKDVKVYAGIFPHHFRTDHIEGQIVDVQCGYEHYLLLTDTGKVYTWGNGRRYQLGHGCSENLLKPREVRALSNYKIRKIRAGGWHTVVVTASGTMYVWGWNECGQLGLKTRAMRIKELRNGPSRKTRNSYPIASNVKIYGSNLKFVSLKVIDVRCGSKHTIIMLSDYSVWAAGSNEYGQLGLPLKECTIMEHFVKVYQGTKDSVLHCGPWNTIIKD